MFDVGYTIQNVLKQRLVLLRIFILTKCYFLNILDHLFKTVVELLLLNARFIQNTGVYSVTIIDHMINQNCYELTAVPYLWKNI